MSFPASQIVHWATGPVYCCDRHATALKNLGSVLGVHVHAENLSELRECSNCKNEAEKLEKEKTHGT